MLEGGAAERMPKARRDLTVVELDGEAVVYDDLTRSVHHLNRSAALLFSMLDGNASLDDLADDVAAVYGAPVDEVDVQLRGLVETLHRAGLLEDDGVADHGAERR